MPSSYVDDAYETGDGPAGTYATDYAGESTTRLHQKGVNLIKLHCILLSITMVVFSDIVYLLPLLQLFFCLLHRSFRLSFLYLYPHSFETRPSICEELTYIKSLASTEL